MDNEQYIESGLSVGAIKYADLNEIITEEHVDYIDNKIYELDRRAYDIEDDIEEINSSLDNKASKNEVFSMANMGQDIKEAMTGGSVAVVGKNAILTENIVNNQIKLSKLNNDIFGYKYDVNITGTWLNFKFFIDNFAELNFANGITFEIICSADIGTLRIYVGYETEGYTNDKVTATKTVLADGKCKYSVSQTTFKTTPKSIIIDKNNTSTSTIVGVFEKPILLVNGAKGELSISPKTGVTIISEEVTEIASKNFVADSISNIKLRDGIVGINNLTDEAKLSLTGGDVADIQFTYQHTRFQNFIKQFLVVNKKLPPCIIKNVINAKCKVIILDSIGLNAKITQMYDFSNGSNVNIIVPNGGYIGIMALGSDGLITNIGYGSRVDGQPITDLHYIQDYSNLTVGGVVNTTKRASQYCAINVVIEPLTIPTLKNDVEIIKNTLVTDKLEIINQLNRTISLVPSENLQTLYKQNFTNINDTWAFVNCSTLGSGGINLSGYAKTYYAIYQAFDEWKLRAKIKINDINSIFGFSSVDGEWEKSSIVFDSSTKTVKWSDEEITSTTLPATTSTDNVDLTLVQDNQYIVELQRKGLYIKFTIYDIKNSNKISFEKTHKRFHGSLAFVTANGNVDLLDLELKVALYGSCKNIFVGDSITEGLAMGTNDISKRWASLLRDNYFKGNAICCGRGWGTSANALEIINGVFKYGYKSNYVTVMIGTNERSDSKLAIWKTNIVKIYDTIKANGSIPIIVTPPLGKTGLTYIQQMRDFIQEKGWDTIRMDLATSVNSDGITFDSSLSTDGTHFNATGNQKMYERALFDLEMIM